MRRRLDAIAGFAAWLASTPRRLAATWAALALAALVSLSGSPGISRDEAFVLAPMVGEPGPAHSVAPLAPKLSAVTHAVLSPAGLSHVRAARVWTALAGALLSALLVLLGFELAGNTGALLAPALFWLAPRHLQAGLSAAPDLAFASLWLAVAVAYRRAADASSPSRPAGPALAAGGLFGLALATRPDAWVLLPLLAVHGAAARVLRRQRSEAGRTSAAPWALLAMVVAVPVVLLAAWGVPWRVPLRDLASALAPAARRGSGPFAMTALALPATLVLAGVSGLAHSASRLVRASRGALSHAVASEELLLLLLATVPFASAAAGFAPQSGGIRAWLQAMPIVALLSARSLVAAARAAWPSKAGRLTGALALLLLYPALRSTFHSFPEGASTWNDFAGGAPGAASLGQRRQDGGEAAASLLPQIAERARPGARVWWVGVAPAAARLYALDGRLRSDLAGAASPEGADLAVVTVDGGSRDAEYRVWSAFGTARPAAGAYLDEVPLAFVYARPGAWR